MSSWSALALVAVVVSNDDHYQHLHMCVFRVLTQMVEREQKQLRSLRYAHIYSSICKTVYLTSTCVPVFGMKGDWVGYWTVR